MSELIPKHGGYRKLLTFQIAQLIYDITVRFVERYIRRGSRTRDQMEQAARSGVQNIAEGSLASATSKKTELKLTQVARASLEELKLDFQDFLRHRKIEEWSKENPYRQELIDERCKTADDVSRWIAKVCKRDDIMEQRPSTKSTTSTMSTKEEVFAEFSANSALTLLAVVNPLLDRQVERLAVDFENVGGFTERLYRVRSVKRKNQW